MRSDDSIRRIFLAVPAPGPIITLHNHLRKSHSGLEQAKWMRDPNIHLTIYFIGNVPAGSVDDITEIILSTIEMQTEFTLKPDQLCLFPEKKPRMIWVRYQRNKSFSYLAESIHNSLSKFMPINEFHFENPIPHITLARFHSLKETSKIKLPETAFIQDMCINSCELWETVKTNGRSDYKSLMRFDFSG